VELTAAQRRTFERLIRPGPAPLAPEGVVSTLRAELEEALDGLEWPAGRSVRLSKGRLEEHGACEGWLEAQLAGEGPAFAHSARSAAGTLMHRAVQIDVASERSEDARAVVDRAAARLETEDTEFAAHWSGLDSLDRAERLASAAARLVLFRELFPPMPRAWQPVSEQMLRSWLAGGKVVLSGQLDLILGRGSRLLLDLKTGEPWPTYAGDMRFYALLVTLVLGRAPYRVATVFLESMEWQAEDVTAEVLQHSSRRVLDTVNSVLELRAGRAPVLTPGPHCRRCPRGLTCAASSLRQEVRV
jgi:hypothetical protein